MRKYVGEDSHGDTYRTGLYQCKKIMKVFESKLRLTNFSVVLKPNSFVLPQTVLKMLGKHNFSSAVQISLFVTWEDLKFDFEIKPKAVRW